MPISIGLMGNGVSGRKFNISPAVSGRTSWDLDIDGTLTINAGTYTFTPLSAFACSIDMWGAGGNGSQSNGTTGGSTTFDGMTAGGGNKGATISSGTNSPGGSGGSASGGDTNTNGNGGGTGSKGLPNATGGSGGSAPGGGSGGAGGVDTNSGSPSSTGGAGGSPGGGGGGGSQYLGNSGSDSTGGGGGSGARVQKSILIGHFTPNTGLTIVVGAASAVGGPFASGTAGSGGDGQFKIS